MLNLAVLLTQQYRLLSVAAILDVFDTVNSFCGADGQEQPFNISLIYAGFQRPQSEYFTRYNCVSIAEACSQDIVLVPAFATHNIESAIANNRQFIPWLIHQYNQGTVLASFCTGAFLLAASGLLDGKRATTHIDATEALAKAFPHVMVEAQAVVTSEGQICTSGGATSSFHLMLSLIEKYCGRKMAIKIAKVFAIDMDREQQSYFGSVRPVDTHTDELVLQVQQQIDRSFQKPFTVGQMLDDIPASRRNVARRFKQATGLTPIEYLQRKRIEAAKRMLEETSKSVFEVMLEAGYNDQKAFRQVFKKAVGMTPKAYRTKFSTVKVFA
jgi:transcriptional regulator GlxA family with amidase domain